MAVGQLMAEGLEHALLQLLLGVVDGGVRVKLGEEGVDLVHDLGGEEAVQLLILGVVRRDLRQTFFLNKVQSVSLFFLHSFKKNI